jgi:hypothetical protein
MAKQSPSLRELRRIRRELSKEMMSMTPRQRREYAKAAEEVYRGLEKMVKIRSLAE